MTDIFHLNLKTFAGRSIVRNLRLYVTMEAIGAVKQFHVAGFSEFRSSNPAPFGFTLSKCFVNPAGYFYRSIYVGESVFTLPEYICIVWQRDYFAAGETPFIGTTLANLGSDGRISWTADARAVPAGSPKYDSFVPTARGLADYRGIAFVAGRNQAGRMMIFGFMHNTCTTIAPGIPYGMIPTMIDKIKACVPGGADAMIVIGGDFNVRAEMASEPMGLEKVYARYPGPGGGVIWTTGSQAIDFWLCANIPPARTPTVIAYPLAYDLTDHCGIALNF